MQRLLIIDDDELIRSLFVKVFGGRYTITACSSGTEALGVLRDEPFDLVISDLSLPDTNGIEILQECKKMHKTTPFIVITGFGTVESAVEAMKLGAMDYITKPFQADEMSVVIEKALEQRAMMKELHRLREWAGDTYGFENIIGKSGKMTRLFDLVARVADTPTTVLIQGASGTGKELFARAIHQNSSRRDKQFMGINCGALPESLLESELFGHIKGAFTGAIRTKKGMFEHTSGGTLLLDEIGVVSPAVQAKLLRVLQEREIKPVGANDSIKINTRVIAATNDDLKTLVDEGQFREDLYFRLSVIPITIPPLRERKEDIPLLVNHFMQKIAEKIGVAPKTLSSSALSTLIEHEWRGNVRELENVIERLLLTTEGEAIERPDLPEEIRGREDAVPRAAESKPSTLKEHVAQRRLEVERQAIMDALQQAGGNKSQAAKELGISRGSLYNKLRELKELGIPAIDRG